MPDPAGTPPPPPILCIIARPAQHTAALRTLAHILDSCPLATPRVWIWLVGGWSRRPREALAPWSPAVRLVENAPAHPVAAEAPEAPCVLLRAGVTANPQALAQETVRTAGRGPRLLRTGPECSGPPGPGDGTRPGLFGSLARAPVNHGAAGGVLVPAGTSRADLAALLTDDVAAWTGLPEAADDDEATPGLLSGAPAPPGPDGSPEGLAALAGRHTGQPALILGNGRSRPDPRTIADPGPVTFAFNGAWRLGPYDAPTPDWLLIEDRLVAEDEAAALTAAPAPPPLILPTDHGDLLPPGPGRLHARIDWSFYRADRPPARPGFATRPQCRLHAGQTVVYLALQVAFVMGCDPVILTGMDLDYRLPPPRHARLDGRVVTASGPDPNHFDAAYFGPGRRWHLPKTDRMLVALRHAADMYAQHGRRLFNATPGGRLSGPTRIDYPPPERRPPERRP